MSQYKTFANMAKTSEEQEDTDVQTSNNTHSIQSYDERSRIVGSTQLVVVDNFTQWCAPCQLCAPKYDKLGRRFNRPGVCALVKEDIEKQIGNHPKSVTGVPCFHFYVNGNFIESECQTGADMDQIEDAVVRILTSLGHTYFT